MLEAIALLLSVVGVSTSLTLLRRLEYSVLSGWEVEEMSMKGVVGRLTLDLAVLAAVVVITYVLVNPWISTWGAT